jgi:hypothetical protein
MTNANVQGIYFNAQSRELRAVDGESISPGSPWTKFADDPRLGLLAARRELERLGLTDDARGVEWFGMTASDPEQRRRVSNLIRAFRDESDRQRVEADRRQEFWQRLASIFKRPIADRGSGM